MRMQPYNSPDSFWWGVARKATHRLKYSCIAIVNYALVMLE